MHMADHSGPRLRPGPALGRFDRLLQIGPRAERGPAFFFKRRQSRSSRSSGGIADAITCVHSASQRPAVKPVVTRLINDVSFPPNIKVKRGTSSPATYLLRRIYTVLLGASECHTFKYSVYGIGTNDVVTYFSLNFPT